MNLTDTVLASDDAVARVVGGETVLLNLATGLYFGPDPVGGMIWQMIVERGSIVLADICAAIVEEYEVEADVAEADLLALAKSLEDQGLIERQAA